MVDSDLMKGIQAYSIAIQELLEWLTDPRTDAEFNKKYSDFSDFRKIQKLSIEPVTGDTIMLGSVPSGMGTRSLGGMIHLTQILVALGYISAEIDGNTVTYSKLREWKNG